MQQQPPHNGVHSLGGAPGGMLGDSSDLDDSGPSSGGANGRSSRGSERGRRYAAGERGRGVAAAMKQRSSSRGGGGEAYRAKAGHIPQQDKAVEGDSSVRVWNEWRQQVLKQQPAQTQHQTQYHKPVCIYDLVGESERSSLSCTGPLARSPSTSPVLTLPRPLMLHQPSIPSLRHSLISPATHTRLWLPLHDPFPRAILTHSPLADRGRD